MDSLIEASLNAAALRPNCTKHPERPSVMRMDDPIMRFLCMECLAESLALPSRYRSRGYATGLGSEAAQESREAQRYQEEYDNAKPYSKQRSYL